MYIGKKPTNSYSWQESFVLFAPFLTNSPEKILSNIRLSLNNSSSAFSLLSPELSLTLNQNFLEINFNVL